MKCPILGLDKQNRAWAQNAIQTTCLKEECAWWDDVKGRCAILTICFGLGAYAQALKAQVEKETERR